MKTLSIVLVCNAGMSTSLLVKKMETVAKEKGIEAVINAYPVEDIKSHLEGIDIILLGPQVRFKRKSIETLVEGRIPVELIDMTAYGTMNGEKIIAQVLQTLNDKMA